MADNEPQLDPVDMQVLALPYSHSNLKITGGGTLEYFCLLQQTTTGYRTLLKKFDGLAKNQKLQAKENMMLLLCSKIPLY